jgi:hypothetical protein
MLKAVTVVRTFGNLPAYVVLKIADYNNADEICRNNQKLFPKRRRRLDDDDDKENSQAAMQHSCQRKERERDRAPVDRAPVGTVVINPP